MMATTEKSEVKYFTKETLIEANTEALAAGRNRSLEPLYLKELGDDLLFPVVLVTLHNDVEMRLIIAIDPHGEVVMLDVPLETHDAMPEKTVYMNGSEVVRLESDTFYKCTECGEIAEDYAEKLYECNDCGTIFTRDNSADGGSHQCPDCNRFASKIADMACTSCEEGEVTEVQAYPCQACDSVHDDVDEFFACMTEVSA